MVGMESEAQGGRGGAVYLELIVPSGHSCLWVDLNGPRTLPMHPRAPLSVPGQLPDWQDLGRRVSHEINPLVPQFCLSSIFVPPSLSLTLSLLLHFHTPFCLCPHLSRMLHVTEGASRFHRRQVALQRRRSQPTLPPVVSFSSVILRPAGRASRFLDDERLEQRNCHRTSYRCLPRSIRPSEFFCCLPVLGVGRSGCTHATANFGTPDPQPTTHFSFSNACPTF